MKKDEILYTKFLNKKKVGQNKVWLRKLGDCNNVFFLPFLFHATIQYKYI